MVDRTDGRFYLRVFGTSLDGRSTDLGKCGSNCLDGQWHHLAFTWDKSASTLTCYLDYAPIGSRYYVPNKGSDHLIGKATDRGTAKFETSRGGPAHEVPFAKLASLSESSDPSIRYYSGTVTYRRTIDVPHAWSDGQVFLDLGEVCDASRVFVNGKEVGTTWHAPHRVELTGMLKAGANELVVKVGNRWINRLIGDEEAPLPAGDRWVDKGEIQLLSSPTLPAVLLEGKQPEGRFAYGTCRPYKKGEKLRPAGLIGPVRLTLWTTQGKTKASPSDLSDCFRTVLHGDWRTVLRRGKFA